MVSEGTLRKALFAIRQLLRAQSTFGRQSADLHGMKALGQFLEVNDFENDQRGVHQAKPESSDAMAKRIGSGVRMGIGAAVAVALLRKIASRMR